MDDEIEIKAVPTLVALPTQYKKYYADLLFSLIPWVRSMSEIDYNNYRQGKDDKFLACNSFCAIWKIYFYVMKNSRFKYAYIYRLVKEFCLNLLFSLKLIQYKIFSFLKKNPKDLSKKELAIYQVNEEYIRFSQKEPWYSFDFMMRISSLWTVKSSSPSLSAFIHIVCTYIRLFVRAVIAAPIYFFKSRLDSDEPYMILEVSGVPRIDKVKVLTDCSYIGAKPHSTYIKALRYRDLSHYVAKFPDSLNLLSVADIESLMVSCSCDKDYDIDAILPYKIVFFQIIGSKRKRLIFEIKAFQAKGFLHRIEDTPIRLEGISSF